MDDATEYAFQKWKYNGNNKGMNLRVLIVIRCCPFFSSKDKYESGSGWPSFSKPIDAVIHWTNKPVCERFRK